LTHAKHRIALLPGDGIGQEVCESAVRVLDVLARRHGFELVWTEFPWGCDYYLQTGSMMAPDALETLASHDAILLGAVGSPKVKDHVSLWGLLIPIRRTFNQYVNLRPVRSLRGVRSALRSSEPIDFLIVRENSEGEYSEAGGRLFAGTPRELAIQESIFSRIGIERIVNFAADAALERKGKLVSATKSNGIIHTMPFWDEVASEVAESRGVPIDLQHIDALAARFVLAPQSLDVVVASNLFGDILSDLGSALTGGIGLGPSANLNPERDHPSMFESIHGSAPDIAGLGVANPTGELWASSMMLEHLGEVDAARELIEAVETALSVPGQCTRDLGGTGTTRSFTNAVVQHLELSARNAPPVVKV
jgi:tartrate dehydrogenase/decarboxylase/D-malate dehydrogenase